MEGEMGDAAAMKLDERSTNVGRGDCLDRSCNEVSLQGGIADSRFQGFGMERPR